MDADDIGPVHDRHRGRGYAPSVPALRVVPGDPAHETLPGCPDEDGTPATTQLSYPLEDLQVLLMTIWAARNTIPAPPMTIQ